MKNLTYILLYLLPLMAGAQSVTDWYPVKTENKPYVRWWWHGSAVDPEGLEYNIGEFARQGIGGVEVTPIYGVQGNEANDIDYLSPRWMEMFGLTERLGRQKGVQVDMNNGTGWPFGGPEVTVADAAPKMIIQTWKVASGKRVPKKIVASHKRQRPIARLQRVLAVNGDVRHDVTRHVGADTMLRWTAPADSGEWTVYALFSGRTFQQVKRAAPGGEGLVVNHYDSVAVKRYLDRFDRAFAASGTPWPHSFFNDSYEVYGSDWTDNLPAEFLKDHGYDILDYLPELAAETGDITRARVIRDYRYTLARLLHDNFTRVWTHWAHGHGSLIRNQSHGSPANILDLYAAVDIPECETFGQSDFNIPGLAKTGATRPSDADPAVLKFASSAAHLAGKPLTSAETLTWLTEHFHTSLARCKPELDQMFASGVNHVFFHGAPYSPKDAPFPGWLFYASINMSPTNTIWCDADALFDYIARCQAFLSAGTPDNDYLLYFPIEDIWHANNDKAYLMFDIHKMDQRMPAVKKAVNNIIAAGYDVDYVSDALLGKLRVDADGALVSAADNRYKAVIVPEVRFMDPATLQRLVELQKQGARVIFTGAMPTDAPGLGDLAARQSRLAELLSDNTFTVAPDITAAANMGGAVPESMRTDHGLTLIRRRNEAGGYNYFVSLLKDQPLDGWIELSVDAPAVVVYDPVSGRSGLAQVKKTDDGKTQVRLQMAPGQSLLLKTLPAAGAHTGKWAYVRSPGQPIVIDRGWQIRFTDTYPEVKGTFKTDKLTAWTALPDSLAHVTAGTARYSITLDVKDLGEADEWLLDLGDVRHSARVYVNGKYAGTAWSVPFALPVGAFLKKGKNKIDIDVTGLQANLIAEYERQGRPWRVFKDTNINGVTGDKSFAGWEPIPAGLNSTVKLIPLTLDK